jgi:vacuole morphology and inheritance protein 14
MEASIARSLNDKLYDKRKIGALEYVHPTWQSCDPWSRETMLTVSSLERVIRDLATAKEFDRIQKIIQQLCNDFAYAVHQPHARNGGLIGLAAAAIALGPVRGIFNVYYGRTSINSFYRN